MNNTIELSPEKITKLFNELIDVLSKISLAVEDDLTAYWEDFKRAYDVLINLEFEKKLSRNEGNLLSQLLEEFEKIIDDKEKEIQNLIDKNIVEGQSFHGEEFQEYFKQWREYDKKRDTLSKLHFEITRYAIEIMKIKSQNLEIQLKRNEESSRKILAEPDLHTEAEIQKAKEFLLLFYGEEP